jgi:hypothetical protein
MASEVRFHDGSEPVFFDILNRMLSVAPASRQRLDGKRFDMPETRRKTA